MYMLNPSDGCEKLTPKPQLRTCSGPDSSPWKLLANKELMCYKPNGSTKILQHHRLIAVKYLPGHVLKEERRLSS